MKPIFNFLFLTVLTLPLVLSCSKEDGSSEGPSRPSSSISVNPSSLILRQEGETQLVSVKASGKWAFNGTVPWLTISPDAGDGDEIISVTAEDNPDTDERNATLSLICGDASAKLTIIQKQKDALTVTSNKQEVEAIGGTVDIEVKSNVEYTVEIDAVCKDWISRAETKSMITTHVYLDVAQNIDFEKREGKVIIRSGNLSEEITIFQDGSEPVIVISQNEYTLPSKENELKIEVKSNVEVAAAIQQGVDWISRNETKSVSTSTFHYSIKANSSEEPRSAEIIFSNSEYGLKDVVKVTQLQKSAIVVAKTSYEIDSKGGSLNFPVQHNTEYLVSVSEDWVKREEQTKAMQTTNEFFTVEANTLYDPRTATITFTSSDNSVKQVITLTQKQLDEVIPEKENMEIKGEGGNFDVKLQTNAKYTVEISDETWIHQITEQTKSLVSNTLHFSADANRTGEDRTGWIRIKIDGSDKVTAIKISQPAVEMAQSNNVYNVGPEGGQVNVNLVTNIPFYSLEITPAEASYWLEQVSTRSTRTDVLTFNVAKNIEYESREATVTVRSNSTKAAITSFVIKQNPQPIPGNVIIYTTKYDYALSLKVTKGYGANLMENTYKDGLGKLVFDDDVKTIPANAFSELNTLTSIILPNCTWSIGSNAFCNCSSMIDLTVPESVTSIESSAFSGCTGTLHCNCNSIEIGSNAFSTIEIGADVTSMPVLRYSYEAKNVVFLNPENIKAIPSYCFQDCSALETIVLPSDVETIGERAFKNSSLKTLTIPDKVKKIEGSTFSGCSALESVTLPSGLTSIGDGAFANSGIKHITIPANVTSLGRQCFFSCLSLASVTFEKGSKLSTITGGYSSGTPYGAFYACEALKSVTIPANVTTIGASAFGECRALESVTVESGGKLKYIEGGYYGSNLSSRQYYGAFYGCSALKSVNLGSNLSSIGQYAFYKCYNLKSVTILSPDAPSLPDSDYTPFSASEATLHFPDGEEWSYSVKGFYRYFTNLPSISYPNVSLDGYTSDSATFTGGDVVVNNALGGETVKLSVYCKTSEYSTVDAHSAVFDNGKCTVKGLFPETEYYWWRSCEISHNGSTYTLHDNSLYNFTTTDYKKSYSANCYVVRPNGTVSFPTVKGNSTISVGSVERVSILWESFGTNVKPNVGDVVKSASYNCNDKKITVVAGPDEGNAVVAAMNSSGIILWSWHIWVTSVDLNAKSQTYENNAGIMMDRNLGATSATPGNPGALGLMYQWGRKDPFLGGCFVSGNTIAASTLSSWPTATSDSSTGTIDYSVEHPTTFIDGNRNNNDWYYTGSSSTDDTRWNFSKGLYDPCPVGWKVPTSDVWYEAFRASSSLTTSSNWDSKHYGMNFGTSWYPASGYYGGNFLYNVGNSGFYWTCRYSVLSYYSYTARGFFFASYGYRLDDEQRWYGHSVRCIKYDEEVKIDNEPVTEENWKK